MVKWCRISHEALDEAEKSLISISGLNIESFRIDIDESRSIFGLSCGDVSKPPLILLHGFLGTSIIFYKLLQSLSLHYRVYCLDLLGMGRSSRPLFTLESREETEDFFVSPIEACRNALGLEKMILAGHSFGGYIAGCYTEKFPERVEKVVFISAVGVVKPPDDYDFEKALKKKKWTFRVLFKVANCMFKKGTTPASLLRKSGPLSGKLVKMYLRRRIKGLPEEELNNLKVVLEQVNLFPGSGEFGLSKILKAGAWAHAPLCDRILATPAIYLYGDKDWMDPEGARQNAIVNAAPVICEIVSNSGHHLYLENPTELGNKIVSGLEELDRMPWKEVGPNREAPEEDIDSAVSHLTLTGENLN
ncbi:unnamed protein product [Blepharisma stoltei]|uniref:AB hydrolase-1 domain-containing protein n=1 Tax=Blepharisma stoltei TaxID=1481888 RepID=A0AAU9IH99_9CILI|nr:unnamed protein product [Blepharisma stoltei]